MKNLSGAVRLHDLIVPSLLMVGFSLLAYFWFQPFFSRSLMGDDLLSYLIFREFPSVGDALLFQAGGKFRPVMNTIFYTIAAICGNDFGNYALVNLSLHVLAALVVFAISRRVAGGGLVVSSAVALMFLTSRFANYSILQAIGGAVELAPIIWLIGVLWWCRRHLQNPSWKSYWMIMVFFILLSFNGERFLVVFPFLLLVIIGGLSKAGVGTVASRLLILATPTFIQAWVLPRIFREEFFRRAAYYPLDTDLLSVLRKIGLALLNVVGINNGPAYLSMVDYPQLPAFMKFLSWAVLILASLLVVLVVASIFPDANRERRKRLFWFLFFWGLIFTLLLLSSSIAGHQEHRWFFPGYVIFLLGLVFMLSLMEGTVFRKAGLSIFLFFAVCTLWNNYNFRSFIGQIYFSGANEASDAFYRATVEKYGAALVGREVVVQEFRDYNWILLDNRFFEAYYEKPIPLTVVKSLSQLSPETWKKPQTIVLRCVSTKVCEEVRSAF